MNKIIIYGLLLVMSDIANASNNPLKAKFEKIQMSGGIVGSGNDGLTYLPEDESKRDKDILTPVFLKDYGRLVVEAKDSWEYVLYRCEGKLDPKVRRLIRDKKKCSVYQQTNVEMRTNESISVRSGFYIAVVGASIHPGFIEIKKNRQTRVYMESRFIPENSNLDSIRIFEDLSSSFSKNKYVKSRWEGLYVESNSEREPRFNSEPGVYVYEEYGRCSRYVMHYTFGEDGVYAYICDGYKRRLSNYWLHQDKIEFSEQTFLMYDGKATAIPLFPGEYIIRYHSTDKEEDDQMFQVGYNIGKFGNHLLDAVFPITTHQLKAVRLQHEKDGGIQGGKKKNAKKKKTTNKKSGRNPFNF